MRYILLFILAILLPVFAFLNFSQTGGVMATYFDFSISFSGVSSGISKLSNQVQESVAETFDAIAELIPEIMDGYESQKAASISLQVAGSDSEALESPPDEDVLKYKIPQIRYTEPTQVPLTTTLSNPYLESFKSPQFFPIRDWGVQVLDIDSAAALAIEPVSHKALYNKNIFDTRPIASLTKIMTALVVIEEMDLGSEVYISNRAIDSYGDQGDLVVDEKISIENLLYILLVSSSNDAAIAIEEYYNSFRIEEDKTFVSAMNKKAQELGLLDTFFVEPSGLNVNNRSNAYDLARLADHAFQRPIIRQMMSTRVIDVFSVDGLTNHHLVNSNELLGVLSGVLAGKTGYTDEAGESIILFVKKSNDLDDYLIYVILGSTDRIKASRELIGWVDNAYIWE